MGLKYKTDILSDSHSSIHIDLVYTEKSLAVKNRTTTSGPWWNSPFFPIGVYGNQGERWKVNLISEEPSLHMEVPEISITFQIASYARERNDVDIVVYYWPRIKDSK